MGRSQQSSFQDLFSLAVELIRAGKKNQAEKALKTCVRLNPWATEPYINLGAIYYSESNWARAEKYFQLALKINSRDPIALYNLGLSLHKQGRFQEAIFSLKESIRLNPKNDNAINQLGTIYNDLHRYREAVLYFRDAIKINPKNHLALYNLGRTLDITHKSKAGVPYLKKAFKVNPADARPLALLFAYYRATCDWSVSHKYNLLLDRLTKNDLRAGLLPGENPFLNVTRVASPPFNLAVAEAWSRYISAGVSRAKKFTFTGRKKNKKIRIGYASDGFRDFPTTHNITGVFENHDKDNFEIFAYSFGPDDKSPFRKRVIKAVDKFIDVNDKNPYQIAEKIYQDNIDILVDLKGFTQGAMPEIPALKPAPIIVSLLGFIGSSGSTYHDYFIGDRFTLPPNVKAYFSEKIVYLPDTYWPTDNHLEVAKKKYLRSLFGLPPKAFIFASFNQTYKIEKIVFDTWLRILKRVPNSILWQYCTDSSTRRNLTAYAKAKGLNPKRLFFAKELPKKSHLARIRDITDLALDTGIVNGHTTTTDCLWVGVPVVTVLGTHFASRVSASMLNAMGLTELVSKNLTGYEDLAVNLATDKEKLNALRRKILRHKDYPLFDTQRYLRNLEKAYLAMYKRFWEGKSPKEIVIK